ncbi:HD-GYP domain-containing protein [Phosphitispora sp. TUW77]|uniref:HD-GYP domain-containing protein n=1 Tax=Phosphitispora sp. TUW77 TaxID=3152361 RepID=UPI003AB3C938
METGAVYKGSLIGHKIVAFFTMLCGLLVVLISIFHVNEQLLSPVAIYAMLSFIAQLMPVRLSQGTYFSVAFILDLVLIALYGVPTAIITRFITTFLAVFFAKLLGRNESFGSIVKLASQMALITGVAGIVYLLDFHPVAASVIASVVYFLVYTIYIAAEGMLHTGGSFSANWFSAIKTIGINYFALAFLTYLLVYVIRYSILESQLFVLLLFFVPVMLVSHAFRLSLNIRQSYLKTVKTLANAIEAKDPHMKGHSERVAELTLALAKESGFSEKDLQKLLYVALLHDAGKIGVSDEILNKSGTLSYEEYEAVKQHAVIGAEILQKIKFLSSRAPIVMHHHERYNGTGYPNGLRGENIPLVSRFLALADAYDAMTTDRPFRQAKTPQQAVEEIERLAGAQFDPNLIEKFKTVLLKRGEI